MCVFNIPEITRRKGALSFILILYRFLIHMAQMRGECAKSRHCRIVLIHPNAFAFSSQRALEFVMLPTLTCPSRSRGHGYFWLMVIYFSLIKIDKCKALFECVFHSRTTTLLNLNYCKHPRLCFDHDQCRIHMAYPVKQDV